MKRLVRALLCVMGLIVLGVCPYAKASAKSSSDIVAGGGLSSYLDLLGNSYEVDVLESDTMVMVLDKASELGIEFDMTPYENEYANFAIAKASSYINVRSNPDTVSEIVGHMYNGSVCEILEKKECEDGIWFNVVSGNVEGYVRSDNFIYGDEACENIENYVKKVAIVQCNYLNVRASGEATGSVIGSVKAGDELELAIDEEADIDIKSLMNEEYDAEAANESEHSEWIKVQYTSNKQGYVCLDYVVIRESYVTAKTIAEEEAEAKAKREAEAARAAAAAAAATAKEDTTIAAPNTGYSDTSELRNNLVAYAQQFVGTRYVMGGQSLSGGTDCSGFTCYVYAAFGYSIGRTPSSQYSSAGRSISLDEIKPGDIICYGYGSCSHVAIYIGNSQIVHEANSRLGCCISSINFEPIVGVKNVID